MNLTHQIGIVTNFHLRLENLRITKEKYLKYLTYSGSRTAVERVAGWCRQEEQWIRR